MQDYASIAISIACVAVVLIMIKHGYTEKLYAASALFLRLVVSFLAAMTFYRAVAFLTVKNTHLLSEYMAIRLSFLVLLWGTYVLLTELHERWMEPEHVIVPRGVDHVGGMIFGALAGAVLVGLLLLTWAYLPVGRVIRPVPLDEAKLPVDMGKVLIEEYAHLSGRMKSPREFDRDAEVAAYRAMDAQEFSAEVAPKPPQSPAPAPEPAAQKQL